MSREHNDTDDVVAMCGDNSRGVNFDLVIQICVISQIVPL